MKRLFTLLSALWVSLFLFQAHGVTIGDGTYSGRVPYYLYDLYSTTQSIYTASEIGGAMEIGAIAYNVAWVSSITVSSLEIYMGHRANDKFANSSDCETLDNLTLVYSGAPTLASSYGWEPIALDTPFSYNGQDHLVVVVCKKSSVYSAAEYYQSWTSKTQCLLRYNDSSNYSDPSNASNYSTTSYRPNIMLIGSDYVKDGIIYDIDSEEAIVWGARTVSADVTIPSSIEIEGKSYNVTSIAKYAFCGNDKLKSLIIPNSVTSIGERAFYGCTGLLAVILSTSLTAIDKYTFYNCFKLKSLTIPNSVTSIGERAFYGTYLRSLTIGSGVTSIGNNACINYPTKTIWLTNTPPSGYSSVAGTVNYVSNNNFSSLSNVKVYSSLSSLFEVGGVKYAIVSPSERTCDAIDCTYDTINVDITIGSTVSYRNVEMKVLSVNDYTCYDNDNIQHLDISNPGNIGKRAFYDCDSLTTVKICNQGNIGSSAFENCTAMSELTLGDSISSIGQHAFDGCKSLVDVVIPDAVSQLSDYSFRNCSSLQSFTIGQNVAQIGSYVWDGCSNLTDITVPANTEIIGDYSFQGCTSLSQLIIADRKEKLSLGNNGSKSFFSDCPLDYVYLGGKISYNTSSSYGYSPFYRNTTLRSVVITDEEDTLYDNEFYGCTNLQEVKLGDGVKQIGNWAFSGCAKLNSFTFGSGLESIGKEAFSDCTSLTKLVSEALVPPTCGSQALEDINKWDCTLYVPAASIADYQSADQWKDFFFVESNAGMVDDEDDALDTIERDQNVDAHIFNINGTPVTNLNRPGLYIKDGQKVMMR